MPMPEQYSMPRYANQVTQTLFRDGNGTAEVLGGDGKYNEAWSYTFEPGDIAIGRTKFKSFLITVTIHWGASHNQLLGFAINDTNQLEGFKVPLNVTTTYAGLLTVKNPNIANKIQLMLKSPAGEGSDTCVLTDITVEARLVEE
jgi:hypothetical protein